jgi:hypothetical protein
MGINYISKPKKPQFSYESHMIYPLYGKNPPRFFLPIYFRPLGDQDQHEANFKANPHSPELVIP